ncbi:MAG: hypothetical protein WA584_12625 [Pyrinomonadaceae bacterium]
MNQEIKNDDYDQNQQRVYKHLRRADLILIVLPMILLAALLIVYPIVWSVYERLSGHPTEIGGFNFDGLVIILGIMFCCVLCTGYGFLALLLSLLTRRNKTFRILLVGIALIAAAGIISVPFLI